MVKHCYNCPRQREENCSLLNLNLQSFDREEIEHDLVRALELVFQNEKDLLDRDVHERTLLFYLTHYFIVLHKGKYVGYNIDPEYNRNGKNSKYYHTDIVNEPKKAIPDFIIHKRNCNKYNLFYLELKKNNHDDADCEKIKRFMSDGIIGRWGGNTPTTFYSFRYGVSVAISADRVSLNWYRKKEDNWIQNDYLFRNGRLERKN